MMENQRYGCFDDYFPGSLWNFRRFADRRLKTLHIIGFYNAAVLALLTVGKNLWQTDRLVVPLAVSTVSFCIALIGFAVEIPRLSQYFEKLDAKLRREVPFSQRSRSYRSGSGFRTRHPIHLFGVTFYVLLMLLWIVIFCLVI